MKLKIIIYTSIFLFCLINLNFALNNTKNKITISNNVLYETCQQYLERRLREGWIIINESYPYYTIKSPEGATKTIDIRNDIITLYPDGDYEVHLYTTGRDHYTELIDNNSETYVYYEAGESFDIYTMSNLPSSSYARFFKKLTIYIRIMTIKSVDNSYARIGFVYGGGQNLTNVFNSQPDTWEWVSASFSRDPRGNVWEETAIDGSNIRLELSTDTTMYCSEMYIEVEYERVIVINNNDDFLNYPFSGMGTQSNPYILDVVDTINASGYNYGVYIANTTKYYEIVCFNISYSNITGVYLLNTTNATHLRFLELFECGMNGVFIENSTDIRLAAHVKNVGYEAVKIYNSTNVVIHNSSATNTGYNSSNSNGAFFAWESTSIIYDNITVSYSYIGLDFYNTTGIWKNSKCFNNTMGVYPYKNVSIVIDNISSYNNTYGGYFYYDWGNIAIYNSSFYNNIYTNIYIAYSENFSIYSSNFSNASNPLVFGNIRITNSQNITFYNCSSIQTASGYHTRVTSSSNILFNKHYLVQKNTTFSISYHSGDYSVTDIFTNPSSFPEGWYSLEKYVKVDGNVNLFIHYEDETNESKYEMWKYDGSWYKSGWYSEKGMNTEDNYVWANITSSSIFSILYRINSENGRPIISNVSPENNSIHVEIYGNPPDGSGYVNLSFTITDETGGGDLEFYLDVFNGTEWVNRLHLTDQDSGSWYHHENEYPFNYTNQICQWRICAKDGTTGEWTNETYSFRTDCKPNPPYDPIPENNSKVDAGNIVLKVKVSHPDGVPVYNVSFYEYPSGRLIGYNYSSTGFLNDTIVQCNSTFYTEKGNVYYWYAKAMDDEYWGNNSNIFCFSTNYTDIEPSYYYYSIGAMIYVVNTSVDEEPPIYYYSIGAMIYVVNTSVDEEPPIYYYSFGATINVSYLVYLSNPYPANNSNNIWINTPLRIDASKCGDAMEYTIVFYSNCTNDGSWIEIGRTYTTLPPNQTIEIWFCWFCELEFNKKYYWYVKAIENATGKCQNSDIYCFSTNYTDIEPSYYYYSIGAMIYVVNTSVDEEPLYYYSIGAMIYVVNTSVDEEPPIYYYSYGIEEAVFYPIEYTNLYPNNINLSDDRIIFSSLVRKDGEEFNFTFSFYINYSNDGSFIKVYEIEKFAVNNELKNISFSFYDIEYGRSYSWFISAYNSTLNRYYNSSICYFNLSYSSYIDCYYYSYGAEVSVNKPHFKEPYPPNGTIGGFNSLNFSILVYTAFENYTDIIDEVCFYWYPNNTMFGKLTNVESGSRPSVYVNNLQNYTWYYWYVTAKNGNWNVSSDIYSYYPYNILPIVIEEPINGSNNVTVYRKLVSGEWRRFVRLKWTLIEPQGQGMSFILYVKHPSTGEWIQRWSILDYNATNGTYYHDEDLFNETMQTYYWRLWVSDGYNETLYEFNFFTQFFIDFWWIPEYPTQEDIIHFYSITEGADDFVWDFGDGSENVNGVNETTHRYIIAGFYNVTLYVYNATNDRWGYLTKEIKIDRNISLKTPQEGIAGYNWFAWHGDNITSYELANKLNLSSGWIHYYNRTAKTWDGWFIDYNIGINSLINNWDVAVIVIDKNSKTRINFSEVENYTMRNTTKFVVGYNVIPISRNIEKNANEFNISNGEWIYKWNTIERKWYGYLKGIGGDNFNISGYDVVVVYAVNERGVEI